MPLLGHLNLERAQHPLGFALVSAGAAQVELAPGDGIDAAYRTACNEFLRRQIIPSARVFDDFLATL